MRSAEADRYAEALRRAHDDVGPPFAGRCQQRQRKKIGGGDDVPAARPDRRGERAIVAHVAVRTGTLQQHAERVGHRHVVRATVRHVDAQRRRARADDVDRLRKHIIGDEKTRALARADPPHQRHRFGGGRGFVEHRCVGDRHAGQIANHRLKVDERLESPLRDLRLVRRIRRVPRGILEDVPRDHRGRMRAIIALSDERFRDPVLCSDRAQPRERLRFGQRSRQRKRDALPDRGWHERVDQRGPRIESERAQHRRLIVGRRADVPAGKRVTVFERRERRGKAIVHVHQAFSMVFEYAGASSSPTSAFGSDGRKRKSHAAYAS